MQGTVQQHGFTNPKSPIPNWLDQSEMSGQGRNQGIILGKQSQWVGIICPSGYDRVYVSENLSKAAALPA